MSKQTKAIIMLLILLISLRTPVMAADTDTSSTNIDSTISPCPDVHNHYTMRQTPFLKTHMT